VFANFCANYFAKNIFIAREKNFYSDLACFALLTFCYNFPFQHFFARNVRKCVQNVCQKFLRLCAKLFLQFIWHSFLFCNFSFFFLQASHAIVE
jgi:hypothetical protein